MTGDSAGREPLSSEEMIARVRAERASSSDELLAEAKQAVSEVPDIPGLDNIQVEIPIDAAFPEPLPRIQPNRRVTRRPVPERSPVASDRAPRVLIVAIVSVILLITIAVFAAAVSVSGGP